MEEQKPSPERSMTWGGFFTHHLNQPMEYVNAITRLLAVACFGFCMIWLSWYLAIGVTMLFVGLGGAIEGICRKFGLGTKISKIFTSLKDPTTRDRAEFRILFDLLLLWFLLGLVRDVMGSGPLSRLDVLLIAMHTTGAIITPGFYLAIVFLWGFNRIFPSPLARPFIEQGIEDKKQ